ncbi:hypothetical protein Axy22_075 [Achromobacter phage vB_AxyP_19-32_Axy22]|uniref:Uncharacterized protein n=1 Tax=Achromobacter phage vB_AxyP_19-32_Axy22 TaxID=2591046 RepID=A0A514CVW8_9CAUD|nr:hypothetical protein Axy22_075 [Achromobacter phage vB_AxyP_19-32_Axy22]
MDQDLLVDVWHLPIRYDGRVMRRFKVSSLYELIKRYGGLSSTILLPASDWGRLIQGRNIIEDWGLSFSLLEEGQVHKIYDMDLSQTLPDINRPVVDVFWAGGYVDDLHFHQIDRPQDFRYTIEMVYSTRRKVTQYGPLDPKTAPIGLSRWGLSDPL